MDQEGIKETSDKNPNSNWIRITTPESNFLTLFGLRTFLFYVNHIFIRSVVSGTLATGNWKVEIDSVVIACSL